MPFETEAVDRVVHLLIFLAAAAAIGIGALGAIERLAGDDRHLIKLWHLVVPVGLFAVLLAVERAYHAFA